MARADQSELTAGLDIPPMPARWGLLRCVDACARRREAHRPAVRPDGAEVGLEGRLPPIGPDGEGWGPGEGAPAAELPTPSGADARGYDTAELLAHRETVLAWPRAEVQRVAAAIQPEVRTGTSASSLGARGYDSDELLALRATVLAWPRAEVQRVVAAIQPEVRAGGNAAASHRRRHGRGEQGRGGAESALLLAEDVVEDMALVREGAP